MMNEGFFSVKTFLQAEYIRCFIPYEIVLRFNLRFVIYTDDVELDYVLLAERNEKFLVFYI